MIQIRLRKPLKMLLGSHMLSRIVILLALFSTCAHAQVAVGGAYTQLKKGEQAPFDGWLYNNFANAKMLSKFQFINEECKLKIDFEVKKKAADLNLTIKNSKLKLDNTTKTYEKLLVIKDTEIERLTTIALKTPSDKYLWWGAGGFITGTLVTIAITYSVNSGY